MKRFIFLSLLISCSDPVSTAPTSTCKPLTCADFKNDTAQVCGKVYDGCSKDLDCGECSLEFGGGGHGGAPSTSTSSTSSSTASSASSTGSTSSTGLSEGEGGENMCQDLTFEK